MRNIYSLTDASLFPLPLVPVCASKLLSYYFNSRAAGSSLISLCGWKWKCQYLWPEGVQVLGQLKIITAIKEYLLRLNQGLAPPPQGPINPCNYKRGLSFGQPPNYWLNVYINVAADEL